MAVQKVKLNITPREPFRDFLMADSRWYVVVAHRRAGKTVAAIQKIFKSAFEAKRMTPRPRFAYIAPTRSQAKDIAWAYMVEYANQIPNTDINIGELTIKLPNGAEIKLYSGENYERMRGVYFDGVISDEDADIPPAAFEYVILPCLLDYRGWHVRMGTPKGKNAFYKALKDGQTNPEVFTVVVKASESGILSDYDLRQIKDKIGADAFQQEMECDFNVGRAGAVYADELTKARKDGRVLPVPYDPAYPVYTTWDLGSPENTVVCYWQRVGFQYRMIDCDHNLRNGDGTAMKTGQRVAHMMAKGFSYGAHLLPHDSRIIQYDAMNMITKLKDAGLKNVKAIPRGSAGAEEKRVLTMLDLFASIYFNVDALNEESGFLEALDNYHRKEDKKNGWVTSKIVHDWCSHFCDAFGMFGEAMKANMIPSGQDSVDPRKVIRKANVRVGGL